MGSGEDVYAEDELRPTERASLMICAMKRPGCWTKKQSSQGTDGACQEADDYLKHHLTGWDRGRLMACSGRWTSLITPSSTSDQRQRIQHRRSLEVCHAGIREPLDLRPEDLAPAVRARNPQPCTCVVSHPNKEILQIHAPDNLACASCTGATAERLRAN